MRRRTVAAVALAALVAASTPAVATTPGLNGGFTYQGGGGAGSVYGMTATGDAQTRLTFDAAEEGDPAWSPDGARIAFTSRRDGGNAEIYLMNADGLGLVRFTTDAASDQQPTWSPDGSRIAWSADRNGANFDIYSARIDGSDLRRHTLNDAFPDVNPEWSPDGSAIAFESNRTGSGDIYRLSPSGTESDVRRLTSDGAADSSPTWSPDGRRVAFRSGRTGGGDIYSVSAVAGTPENEAQQHTASLQDDKEPTWSPDGNRIAFASFRNTAHWDVWSVSGTGPPETAPQQITSGVQAEVQPSWQTVAALPFLSSISPSSAQAGSGAIMLGVDGSGFTHRSRVRWQGQDRVTTYVSPTRLSAAIPASDLAAPGTARVEVVTGPVGGGTSGQQTFTVQAPPTRESLTISGAEVQNRWRASRLRGRLILNGASTRAARVRVQVLRPSGRGRALVSRAFGLAAGGSFQRRLVLSPRLTPGPYLVRLEEVGSGPGLLPRAERGATVPAPREGVVSRSFFSTKIGGRSVTRIVGRSIIFAHFRFAARPKPGRRLTVRWYSPGARRPVAVDRKPRTGTVIAFIKGPRALPRGAWRAELRYGRTLVATARVRVG